MKTTNYCLLTNKRNKKNNNIYDLLINGGFIRKLCSGIFIILPNGLKVINNIIDIIKLEMDNFNCMEIKLPSIIPSLLWKKSGRLDSYGNELYKFYDRNNKLFLISPTNEEVITTFFIKERLILKNFPYIFYQIGDKFRDEIRPRFSLVRCKEFIMKDAYSFHKSLDCLNNIYNKMIIIYNKIFKILGLNIFYKEAKCGKIGGNSSHEFHVLFKYGENNLLINKNIYNKIFYKYKNSNSFLKLEYLYIKNYKNDYYLKEIDFYNFIKTYIVEVIFKNKKIFLILLIFYYSNIDLLKIKNLYPLSINIRILDKKDIINYFNINSFFLGPFGFNYRIIADSYLINFKNFIIGSNINNYLFRNVNWIKNINVSNFLNISENYNFFLNNFSYNICIKKKSMEIAHIFKLSNYYYNIFNKFKENIFMGCYGIGIFRIFISLIDNYSFDNKLVLPLSISIFKIGIIPINMYNIKDVYDISFKIYNFLIFNKIKVLIEDRNIYFGNIINDFESIGIPNILIISKNLLLINKLEFRDRLNNLVYFINIKDIFNFLLFKYR